MATRNRFVARWRRHYARAPDCTVRSSSLFTLSTSPSSARVSLQSQILRWHSAHIDCSRMRLHTKTSVQGLEIAVSRPRIDCRTVIGMGCYVCHFLKSLRGARFEAKLKRKKEAHDGLW